MRFSTLALSAICISLSPLFGKELDQIALDFTAKTLKDHPMPGISIQKITIDKKIKVSSEYFTGYVMGIDISIKDTNKTNHLIDTFFVSNDGWIATELFSKEGDRLSSKLIPLSIVYDKEHLIFGDLNATDKITIFSDPFCPYCRELLPEIIKKLKSNNKSTALFLYDVPLTEIHPASYQTSIILKSLHKKDRDIYAKFYSEPALEALVGVTDANKLIEEIEKTLSVKVDKGDLTDTKKALKEDEKISEQLNIERTPTIFKNGEKIYNLKQL